jgi:hypothetical protein
MEKVVMTDGREGSDGAKVRIRTELQSGKIDVSFFYQRWNFRCLFVILKVERGESVDDFWPGFQKTLGEEIGPPEEYMAWSQGAAAQLPWIEGQRYERFSVATPPDPTTCVSTDRALRVVLPPKRRHAWEDENGRGNRQ